MSTCRSPTTPCSPTATRPRWSAGTARWTGCASRASTRPRCSAGCSTRRAGHWSIRAVGSRRAATRRYVDRTMVLETTFTTPTGTASSPTRSPWARNEPATSSAPRAPRAAATLRAPRERSSWRSSTRRARSTGWCGRCSPPSTGGVIGRGGADVLVLSSPVPARRIDGRVARARLRLGAGDRHAASRCSTARPTSRRRDRWSQNELDAAPRRHGRGLAVVVRPAPELRRAVARARPPQRPGAAGADLPAERRDRRRRHHLAARGGRRRAQLGLPLHLGARRELHHRRAVGRRLPGRGRRVLRLPRRGRGWRRSAGAPTCRSCSASAASTTSPSGAAAPAGLAEQPAGARRQRRLEPAADRRLRRAARRRASAPRPDRQPRRRHPCTSSSPAPTPRPCAGRRRTRASGRCAASPAHFLYSKLMCWVALDRAIALADLLGARRTGSPAGRERASEIRAAILARRVERAGGAFTQSFGSDDLDASNLMMPIVGFLPADDPRMMATIDAIADAADRRARSRLPLPHRERRARRRGGHVPALHLLAGAGAGAGRRGRPGPRPSSSGPRATPTTWGCSPRRSTRPPVSCSATSRRRSATSAWSTPPGPSPRPWRRRRGRGRNPTRRYESHGGSDESDHRVSGKAAHRPRG